MYPDFVHIICLNSNICRPQQMMFSEHPKLVLDCIEKIFGCAEDIVCCRENERGKVYLGGNLEISVVTIL